MEIKDFTQWLNEAVRQEHQGYRLAYQLVMNDGTELSIQASSFHHCNPRTTEIPNYNWYDEFEIGFPNRVIDKLLPYAEDVDEPTETVYAYVPKNLIRCIVEDCGGVKEVLRGE